MHVNATDFDSDQILVNHFLSIVMHLFNILPCTLLILRFFTNLKSNFIDLVVRFQEEKGGGHYHTSFFFYSRMKLIRFSERSVYELWYLVTGDC